MRWDPDLYRKFERERAAPFEDVVAHVEAREGLSVVDLGCGTGELTANLADRLPGSDVLGIDASAEMLAKAAPRARPGLRFEQRRIEEAAGGFDLVFSHAAIHWVADHDALVPRLFAMVRANGQIAVQLPSNHGHASQRVIREIASRSPFREALEGFTRTSPVLPIERYAEILHAAGATDVVVFEKVYPHLLADSDAVATWTRGTALLPWLERLPEPMREPFFDAYREALRVELPSRPVFFPFKRTIFVARRPA